MSLQRTPVSGAIVKQRLSLATTSFIGANPIAVPAGTYVLPPLVAPYGGTTPQAQLAGSLVYAAFAVRMQDDGAVVAIEVKNRVTNGVAADVVTYKVAKILSTQDFTLPVVPVILAPGDLELDVANTDPLQKRAAIPINDAAAGSYLDGDYLVLLAVVPAGPGLTIAPAVVDAQIEFFTSR